MSDMDCPYCEAEVTEIDEAYDQETPYENHCEKCGKNFIYYVSYMKCFDPKPAPCRNGEDHDYEKIIGYPKEYYKNRYRCKYCEDKKIIHELE